MINYNYLLYRNIKKTIMNNLPHFQKNKNFKLFYKLFIPKKNGVKVFMKQKTVFSCYNQDKILINDVSYNINNCVFRVLYNQDTKKYHLYINLELISIIDDYDDIQIEYNNSYDLSINYPLSIEKFDDTHWENLNYLFSTFPVMNKKYQLNICHIDDIQNNSKKLHELDHTIEKQNCNYIYVDKPNIFSFNLGYTRNLYKFLSLSDNIMFSDIDIPIINEILNDMVVKLNKEKYQVVKPYKNQMFYTNIKQKTDWLKNYTFNYNNYNKFISTLTNITDKKLFTLSGGIFAIKKYLLEQIGGFNELNAYGYEDRFMDIHLLNIPNLKIFKFDNKLFHLYHNAMGKYEESKNIQLLKNTYNKKYYNCFYNKFATKELHQYCKHDTQYLSKLENFHKQTNGYLHLFKQESNLLNYITLKKMPF